MGQNQGYRQGCSVMVSRLFWWGFWVSIFSLVHLDSLCTPVQESLHNFHPYHKALFHLFQFGFSEGCCSTYHTLENSGLCDILWRKLGGVTYIGELWVVWHTLEKTGLCDIHRKKMGGETYIGEFWVARHTLEKTGLCDIHGRILGCITYYVN